MPVVNAVFGLGVALAFVALTAKPALAGPCTDEISRMQARVDAAITANAAAGKMGRESTAAKLSEQPTPKTIAESDARLNKWTGGEKAVAALTKARAADSANNAAACRSALAEAEAAIK